MITSLWSWNEIQGAKLPDVRFKKSLAQVCQDLHQQAGVSYSRACGSKRKAVHRLMKTTEVTPEDILAGHAEQTILRTRKYPFFLAASDTTSLDYTSHKACTGLGPIASNPKTQGFLTHSVIAISPSGTPLGILYQESWIRSQETFGQSKQLKNRPESEKESYKWTKALRGVESLLEPEDGVLLIQDREADIVTFLQESRRDKTHLLIRSSSPRKILVNNEVKNLWEVSRSAPVVAQKTIKIKVKKGKEFTDRDVFLTIRCTLVEIIPPDYVKSDRPNPKVWVICACEEAPPEGEKAIEWILLSTFPVLDRQTALDMVIFYTYRWLIERFHYVLKSGVGIENLQMDNGDSLMKATSFYSIVAWRLLYLVYIAREDPQTPARNLFEELSLRILSLHMGKTICCVGEAIAAIAHVGGFRSCPSAPRAGVKSLWIGLRRLDGMEVGWQIAVSALGTKALQAKDMGQD